MDSFFHWNPSFSNKQSCLVSEQDQHAQHWKPDTGTGNFLRRLLNAHWIPKFLGCSSKK